MTGTSMRIGRCPNRPDNELEGLGAVAHYPHLEYPKMDVRRAGKALSGPVIWSEEKREEIIRTFAIAYSWRDAHFFPMRSVRQGVVMRVRSSKHKGFVVARPKRMSSIRKKLERYGTTLDQIQDLAGVRAVMDDIAGVRALIAECRSRLPHELRKEYPYIDQPKADGYRSHHMVFNFKGSDDDSSHYDGLRVELQVRTRLQHSWATAVEAVGLYRDEDMKAGLGNSDWLRLFHLMSSEFAITEGCSPSESARERSVRIEELRDLNSKLRAVGVLEDLKSATKFAEDFIHDKKSPFYLITYNHETHQVKVHPYHDPLRGTQSLGAVEQRLDLGSSRDKVVLVEADRIASLVEAYPNYFGDVSLFARNLRSICDGMDAVEFTMPPQELAPKRPWEKPDLSWFTQPKRRRWVEKKGRSGTDR